MPLKLCVVLSILFYKIRALNRLMVHHHQYHNQNRWSCKSLNLTWVISGQLSLPQFLFFQLLPLAWFYSFIYSFRKLLWSTCHGPEMFRGQDKAMRTESSLMPRYSLSINIPLPRLSKFYAKIKSGQFLSVLIRCESMTLDLRNQIKKVITRKRDL